MSSRASRSEMQSISQASTQRHTTIQALSVACFEARCVPWERLAEEAWRRLRSATGELADLDVSPVTNYLLQGFLSSVTEDHVTIVNAPLIARSRGIRVSETKSKNHKGVPPAIRTRAVGKEKSRSISGTVYAGSEMRIIEVDGYRMDFAPHGDMLLIPHIDQPGVIGAVGQLLGREKINIAAMRRPQGDRRAGCHVARIDGLPSRQSLDAIKTVDGVLDVYYVRL